MKATPEDVAKLIGYDASGAAIWGSLNEGHARRRGEGRLLLRRHRSSRRLNEGHARRRGEAADGGKSTYTEGGASMKATPEDVAKNPAY